MVSEVGSRLADIADKYGTTIEKLIDDFDFDKETFAPWIRGSGAEDVHVDSWSWQKNQSKIPLDVWQSGENSQMVVHIMPSGDYEIEVLLGSGQVTEYIQNVIGEEIQYKRKQGEIPDPAKDKEIQGWVTKLLRDWKNGGKEETLEVLEGISTTVDAWDFKGWVTEFYDIPSAIQREVIDLAANMAGLEK